MYHLKQDGGTRTLQHTTKSINGPFANPYPITWGDANPIRAAVHLRGREAGGFFKIHQTFHLTYFILLKPPQKQEITVFRRELFTEN